VEGTALYHELFGLAVALFIKCSVTLWHFLKESIHVDKETHFNNIWSSQWIGWDI